MELDLIRLIQMMRNPFFDQIFYFITQFGDQLAFITVAVIIYWTIDKKFAHKFVFTFMLSALVNTGLKSLFRRIRPFYYQGISAEPKWLTTGFSFPSGHAQAAGVLGYTACYVSKQKKLKWLYILGIIIMVLVPFSRMYLGQHFLSDVIVGVILALLIAHLSFKLVDLMGDDEHVYTLMLAPLFILALIFYRHHDLYIAAGGFVGFAVGYYVEKMYVSYHVKNRLWIQIIKVIVGLAIALALKEGLKIIFPSTLFFDFIRYLLIGGWAALGAPVLFKYGTPYLQKSV